MDDFINRLPAFAWVIACGLAVWVMFFITREFRLKKITKILISVIGGCFIVGVFYLYFWYRRTHGS